MSEPIPIVLSWSGGKDCLLMLRRLQADPRYRIAGLLTTVWAETGCVAMHGLPVSLLHAQAEALGLDVVLMEVPRFPSNGVYEAALLQTLNHYRSGGGQTLAFGDLFLADIRQYREELCHRMAMAAVFPLWGIPTVELSDEFIAAGYRAWICCTDSRLGREVVGAAYNAEFVKRLPAGIDPCGENGEFHTFVTDGPEFSRPVKTGMVGTTAADGFYWAQWEERGTEPHLDSIHQPRAGTVVSERESVA